MSRYLLVTLDVPPAVKGVILNVVQEAVEDRHGPDMWDLLLADAGVVGAYTALGNYPDADLFAIIQAAAARLGMSPPAVTRWAGRQAFPHLAERYPGFLRDHDDLFPFLETINDVIHAEVRKLYPGAQTPRFDIRPVGADRIELVYHSERGLCELAVGLTEGAADHLRTPVQVQQEACRHRGHDACKLVITRAEAGA